MQIDQIKRCLSNLAKNRPIFHSEADMQFALAWEIQKFNEKLGIRLEKRFILNGSPKYYDLSVRNEKSEILIELKYKTKKFIKVVGGEDFNLKEQSARDLGRYDFLKDIMNIEKSGLLGFVCFLTNDSGYWKPNNYQSTMCENMRMHEGNMLTGNIDWNRKHHKTEEQFGKSVGKSRLTPISIRSIVKCHWENFSDLNGSKFKYLLIQIDRSTKI